MNTVPAPSIAGAPWVDRPGPSRRALLGSALGALALLQPARAHADGMVRESRFLFGSPIELLVAPRPGRNPAPAIVRVLAMLQRINDDWNAWKPGQVTELNAAIRAGAPCAVSAGMLAMLRSAERLERASSGYFNAAIGGAVGSWGFHVDTLRDGVRPAAGTVAQWRAARPSLSELVIRGRHVQSRNPRVQIDFGAYAKGVAIDLALGQLQAHGVAGALLNLGGNLATIGAAAGRPWRIGIRDPAGGLIASLQTLPREAVITSGSYERFRVLDGERVPHILDPHTATPVLELASATVLHPDAGLADAGATALLAAGPRHWRRVARDMGIAEAMVVDHRSQGAVTMRLARRLQYASPAWHDRMVIA